jgi:hypothetical protein
MARRLGQKQQDSERKSNTGSRRVREDPEDAGAKVDPGGEATRSKDLGMYGLVELPKQAHGQHATCAAESRQVANWRKYQRESASKYDATAVLWDEPE